MLNKFKETKEELKIQKHPKENVKSGGANIKYRRL